MVFDLSATNNLPQSSTSSCTDYFFDGCHSKSLNKCDIQYKNCQCRPCCINSMINDHTYTLLKKICRKVIRDYQRRQSREKYTIFDGGNSINVRIHRSSFAPVEDGKCKHVSGDPSSPTLRETKQKDGKYAERKKNDSFSERNEIIRRKKKGRYDDDDGGGTRHIDDIKNRRKNGLSEPLGVGLDKRKKGRDREDVNEKQRKGKENRDDVDGKEKQRKGNGKRDNDIDDRKEKHDRGLRDRDEKRDGGDNDDQSNDLSRKRNDKAKRMEHVDKEGSDKDRNKKAASKKIGNEIDEEGRLVGKADGKTGRKKPDKGKGGNGNDSAEHDEKKFYKSNKNTSGEDEATRTASKLEKDKKRGSNDGRKKEGANKNNSGDNKGPAEKGFNGSFKAGKQREPGSGSKHYQDYRLKVHKEKNRGSASRKRKDLLNLPVISDLRAKVRRGHEVNPIQSHRKGKAGSRSSFSQEGGKKQVDRRQKHHSKISTDRINEQHDSKSNRMRSRNSRGLGLRFVRYREYRTTMLSRCDEIKPCDILRAHMEQRELCERQRCYCLPYPSDCSAVYCQVPSTICSHLY